MWASSAHVQLSPETLQLKRSIRDTNFVAKHHMRKIMCFWKIRACKPDNKRLLTSLIITNLLLCLHVTVCFSLCASQADQTKLVLVWINKAAWIWTSIISCNKKNIYLHFQLFSSRLFVCLFVCFTMCPVCLSSSRHHLSAGVRTFERGAHDVSSVSCRSVTRGGERAAVCSVIRAAGPQPELLPGHDDGDLTSLVRRWSTRRGESATNRESDLFIFYIWSCKYVDVCVMIGGRRCFRAVSQAMCCSPPLVL